MKTIVLIGASMRAQAYVQALQNNFSETHKIVAVMELDEGKMRSFNESSLKLESCISFIDIFNLKYKICKNIATQF